MASLRFVLLGQAVSSAHRAKELIWGRRISHWNTNRPGTTRRMVCRLAVLRETKLGSTESPRKYKRPFLEACPARPVSAPSLRRWLTAASSATRLQLRSCLLYTSDAADERSSVDLGG